MLEANAVACAAAHGSKIIRPFLRKISSASRRSMFPRSAAAAFSSMPTAFERLDRRTRCDRWTRPGVLVKEMLSTRSKGSCPIVRAPDRHRQGESLLFRDVTLLNSPCYTLWLIGCNNVNIDGVTIHNPHDGPNTDGIDVDCCSNVRVANCSIDGGDDAIAIKSDSGTLGEDKPCENVTVTNCVLCSVPACEVRIGYEGDAVIRNCTFEQSHHLRQQHRDRHPQHSPQPAHDTQGDPLREHCIQQYRHAKRWPGDLLLDGQ